MKDHAKKAVESLFCVTSGHKGQVKSRRQELIALRDADCTTVRGEFDFGEAHPNGAEEPVHEFRR